MKFEISECEESQRVKEMESPISGKGRFREKNALPVWELTESAVQKADRIVSFASMPKSSRAETCQTQRSSGGNFFCQMNWADFKRVSANN